MRVGGESREHAHQPGKNARSCIFTGFYFFPHSSNLTVFSIDFATMKLHKSLAASSPKMRYLVEIKLFYFGSRLKIQRINYFLSSLLWELQNHTSFMLSKNRQVAHFETV